MEVYTTTQIAKIVQVSIRTVAKWIDTGLLKGWRIPGSRDRRVEHGVLVKFLKEHNISLNGLIESICKNCIYWGRKEGLEYPCEQIELGLSQREEGDDIFTQSSFGCVFFKGGEKEEEK